MGLPTVHIVYVDQDTFVVYPGQHMEGDTQVGIEHAGFEQAIAAATKTAARTASSPMNGAIFGAYEFAMKVPGMHWHPTGQVPLYAKSGRGFLVNAEDFFIIHELPKVEVPAAPAPAFVPTPAQKQMTVTDAVHRIKELQVELAHLQEYVSMVAIARMQQ